MTTSPVPPAVSGSIVRHILLVEDLTDDAEMMAAVVRRASPESRLHTVRTAAAAIAYLAGTGEWADRTLHPLPALVLLDLGLPDTHGSSVLAWLSRQQEKEKVPVAVITASADSADLQHAFALGADAYILKPVTPEALGDAIAALAPRLDLPVRVLIVDDNGDDRRLASDLLTGAIPGVTVLEAASLQEIEPVLAGGPFDAVVSDPYSTAGCGLDRLRYVRVRCPDCAVILIAGAAGGGELLRALRAGVDDYVLKDPINIARLGTAVRASIARRRQRAALAAAERSLRDSQKHADFLADLLERASVAFGVGYPDGRLGACNAAFAALTGYSRAELTAIDWATELTPPEWLAAEREHLDRLHRTGEPVRYEKEYIRRDGSRVPIELTVHLLRNDDGSPRLYFAFLTDLTERKQAELALRESEDRHRDLVEHSRDLICTHDLEGNILSANPATARALGWGVDAVVGRNVRDVLVPGSQEGFDAYLAAIRASGAARGRMVVVTRSGAHRIWEYDNTLRTEGVKSPVVRGLGHDITERVLAERALRESEEKYRTILAGMMEGYWESDLAGSITFCNEACARILGRDAASIVGMNNRAFMDADTATRVYATFTRIRSTGVPARALDWELIRGDGSRVAVEVSAYLRRDAAGRPVGFAGALRDVSEQRHVEEQLRHSQKLEAVGVLAGGVAHDFNNLLQAMLGQLQLLHRQADSAERIAGLAHEMEALVTRGASLTRQLLLFSRRETARPERLDLARLLSESVSMLRRLVPANIALELDTTPATLPIEGDRSQLEQVLVNLTVNATDAMIGGGSLRLHAGRVDDATAFIAIEDTGCGIPAELQNRVFEPFFTTKPPGRGTGLGLAVVHGIVARHGGRVELASTVGRGTTVTVLLPALGGDAEGPADASPATDEELPAGRGERILVVEDEAPTRESLAAILAALGYAVVAAASGEEAKDLAAASPFDLLVTDLMLPGLSGPRLAAELQEQRPELQVILMSGYARDEAVRLGVFAGVLRFLQKPFEIVTLAHEVRDALDDAGPPASA